MAGNRKINRGKGMFGAAALTFPFQNIEIGKKDIRDEVANPVQKVYAIFFLMYIDEGYSVTEKIDKSFERRQALFSEEIEKL